MKMLGEAAFKSLVSARESAGRLEHFMHHMNDLAMAELMGADGQTVTIVHCISAEQMTAAQACVELLARMVDEVRDFHTFLTEVSEHTQAFTKLTPKPVFTMPKKGPTT